MTPVRALKRKKVQSNNSSSDEETPLASSPAKRSTSGAVRMNGALQATTMTKANGKASAKAVVPSDSDDDIPITKGKRAVNGNGAAKPPKKKVKKEEDSDDNTPIGSRTAPPRMKRKMKAESDDDDDDFSEDEKPLKKAPAKRPTKQAKREATDSETPAPKKRGKTKKEEMPEGSPQKGKKKKKEEEEEDVFRWWENQEFHTEDSSVKWQALEHNGVYFPPPYEPLPSHVKMKYKGMYRLALGVDCCRSPHLFHRKAG